jgi:hypothetical protein
MQQYLIISDGDIIELTSEKRKDGSMVFKYVKSDFKMGLKLPMPESQLEHGLKNNIFKLINKK